PSNATGGGYQVAQQSAAYCQTLTWNLTVPNSLEPGDTIYVIAGGRAYDVRYNSMDSSDSVSFTVPLPPASASLTKTAEAITVIPGGNVLYTLNYSYVNSNSLVITDMVPPNCTLLQISPGGTNSGTAAGSSLSWTLPAVTKRKSDIVWFLVNVDAASAPGTIINNSADWALTDTFSAVTNGTSNDTTVTVIRPFAFTKSQQPATAQMGDTVTYTLSVSLTGYSLKSYDSFDSNPITGYHSIGGSWSWMSDGAGSGYLYSPLQSSYPQYLRDLPTDFCDGIVQGDIYVGPGGNEDGLISFRHSNTNPALAYGIGISGDHLPGDLYLQKTNPGVAAPYCPVTWCSNALSVSDSRWYTVKVQVSSLSGYSTGIWAKAWAKGEAEPAGWMIAVTDTANATYTQIPACGYVGFQGHPDNYNYYDNLKVISGNPIASGAVIFDTVPAEITYLDGTGALAGVHDAAVYDGASSIVSWLYPGLQTDKADILSWTGVINSCGQITNIGSIKANDFNGIVNSNSVMYDIPCGTPSITPTITPTSTITVTATSTITVTSTPTMTITSTVTPTPILPVLAMSKSVAPGTAATGETITYTIRVRNTGLIAADNVIIWDTLPPKHTYISGGVYNAADRVVNYSAASIATGAFMDFSFTAMLDDSINKNEKIYNTAFSNCDVAPSAFVSNQTTLAANVPDLELKKDVTYPNPTDGEAIIVYQLSVRADVTIKVFTISGETVRVIDGVKGVKGENRTLWDGLNTAGERVSSGVYIYKIEAVNGDEKKFVFGKMAVMK
ncbi:MAG TPA: FlgD immunoglobulin-like domain containing protein, partial [Candidatus Goldiibacteriota bacterium]|nr:FlgD immunoglobulin-like domain containing protein [Candidatus Goldiibacteriota bacterium]